MRFERDGLVFNLLDTPGHEDFSEDTYRTLTAVDSAIMVIDAAKGIESQTRKLFEVCRLRDIPIITFINKIDREGRHPFELLDEIKLGLAARRRSDVWPVGMGTDFYGAFDFRTSTLLASSHGRGGATDLALPFSGIDDDGLAKYVSPPVLQEFHEQASLAREGYSAFDLEAFRQGHLTPVIFGSALRDTAVEEVLGLIADYAPPPRPQPTTSGLVEPGDDVVSGFVFKVQANMDPNHRDRIAFLRLCSGKLRRGMKLHPGAHGQGADRAQPRAFLRARTAISPRMRWRATWSASRTTGRCASKRYLAEEDAIRFTGLPSFAPEVLRRVLHGDFAGEAGAAGARRPRRGGTSPGVQADHWADIGSIGVVGVLSLHC